MIPEPMKTTASLAVLGALALLALPGCKDSGSVSVESVEEPQRTFESPKVATNAATGSGDREPIPSTTPPGSSMDPSSNAYIIFDGSGSMAGQPIEEAKRAVAAFVKGAPADLNIGLFIFDGVNSGGREVVPLGRGDGQRAELDAAIARVRADGGTPLGSAIQTGTTSLIAQFQKQLRYGDIRLVVVTDGMASDEANFGRSIRFARDHHVPVYTIGFRIKSDHPLRRYSEAYFTADDEEELLGAMKETLAELDDSVSIDL